MFKYNIERFLIGSNKITNWTLMETYAIEKMHEPIRFQFLKVSLLISETIVFIIVHTIQRGIGGNSWLLTCVKDLPYRAPQKQK